MFDIDREIQNLPEKPGVYIMKDDKKNIIYIGKAIILKNRVKQYFKSVEKQPPKVQVMVSKINEFEYIVTDTELEALILECNLIKKHKPKYNVLLKDDKNYPYIKITTEDFPRVLIVRKIFKDGAKYFGPYSNASAVKQTVELIKKLFPIKTCKKNFSKNKKPLRPCLNYHINQCKGPCQGNIDKDTYIKIITDVCDFLNGHQDSIIKKFTKMMNEASDNLNYEEAAILRDKINSLKHIKEKQKVITTSTIDQDIIACANNQTDSLIQIFFIRSGKLIDKKHFIFEGISLDNNLNELLTSFVKQFYNDSQYIPSEILLQHDIDERDILEKWLSKKKSSLIKIKIPKIGEKQKLIEMVYKNAKISLDLFEERLTREQQLIHDILFDLKNILGLNDIPKRIEAYDISNTASLDIVSSMIVFEKGTPNKNEYRRFKMKLQKKQNDYESMQQTIFRRFNHISKSLNDNAFSTLPDLILIDGGIGHVNSVYKVLKELNIDIPTFGMVKNERHRTKALVSNFMEYDLQNNIKLLRFITSIQDEAHRFANEYNKTLRKKRYTTSILDEIEGIGQARKTALIKHFKSIEKIKSASIEELQNVAGMTKSLSEKVYRFFN